uniref:Uncharacterized protein n=1 Tax=Eutreptiella gymnastica TaxID=73025 RepID=A0A7S1I116_9EUGL|mmetsp:Transcript_119746/g.208489  ORF Transcript_119746/g.208489 Transcript_119746/m.208489 type:complete len:128 (+) Transcript_119746:176-559(+)
MGRAPRQKATSHKQPLFQEGTSALSAPCGRAISPRAKFVLRALRLAWFGTALSGNLRFVTRPAANGGSSLASKGQLHRSRARRADNPSSLTTSKMDTGVTKLALVSVTTHLTVNLVYLNPFPFCLLA